MVKQGKCKFCSQIGMIEAADEMTQEEIDKEVTLKCTCPEAQAFATKEYNRTAAAAFIKDAFKNDEYMTDYMTHTLDAVMNEVADKVQVVQKRFLDSKTIETKVYTMSLNNEGTLIINMKQSYSSKEKF